MQTIKAITILQPWASAIVRGVKRYETRSWATSYRGIIAIHAGKKKVAHTCAQPKTYGAILAIADLIECIPTIAIALTPEDTLWGDFRPGRFAWVIQNVCPLEHPLPWSGQQGLWNIPLEALGL